MGGLSTGYSLTGCNCTHFARTLLRELGAEQMPSWIDPYTDKALPVAERGLTYAVQMGARGLRFCPTTLAAGAGDLVFSRIGAEVAPQGFEETGRNAGGV